ncbi:hypothetical protein [Dialister micraerophilus]|uniref:hypothetical protein n=1 Tax=Dialister micraerophilus TaxID=309120 RepID=UPI0030B8D1A5
MPVLTCSYGIFSFSFLPTNCAIIGVDADKIPNEHVSTGMNNPAPTATPAKSSALT